MASNTQKTLINFNMPTHMKKKLDELTDYKGISRTTLMITLLDEWMKKESEWKEKNERS